VTMTEGPAAPEPADGADAARARLARSLRDSGRAPSPAVQAAFLAVPRHLFVPGLSPARAYQDEALVIKYGDDGVPVSSSSQPVMMAIMLEQLGLAAGHRVLEIGTGTGYNAAVMAHIVGASGSVDTIDIDDELIRRARASLVTAGYPAVRASCADGGYGDPDRAPFDRIIVTAGAWDVAPAWLDQLAPGGRLVLPLAVRGIQLSVALERCGEHWAAASAFRCGFVRMAGAFADPEPYRLLGAEPGRYVQVGDGRPADLPGLAAALTGAPAEVGTRVEVHGMDEVADLDLWLTLSEPALDRLTIMDTAASADGDTGLPLGGLAGRAPGPAPPGVVGLAPAPPEAGAEPDAPLFPAEVVIRGYGAGGAELAAYLAGRAAAWAAGGRPGVAGLYLAVTPPGVAPAGAPAGLATFDRPHVRLTAGWPPG
jgi:protein-L-isoaspartate(D-aspartate) O-methyltransferase